MALSLVAGVDRRLVGWSSARLESPDQDADRQFVREHDWTRLLVDALIVERQRWRRGSGLLAVRWSPENREQFIRVAPSVSPS
jgi:hypothetical protein